MNQELQTIMKLKHDDEYLQEKYSELQKKHANEYVAISDNDIIATGKRITEVITKIKSQGKNPALILIEFIPQEGLTIII